MTSVGAMNFVVGRPRILALTVNKCGYLSMILPSKLVVGRPFYVLPFFHHLKSEDLKNNGMFSDI